MQERHKNRKLYFDEQGITTEKFVIPYIEKHKKIHARTRVLEIGCGEGGNIPPFLNRACDVVGVDINVGQIDRARAFIGDLYQEKEINIQFLSKNIYDVHPDDIGLFDIIFLRDVIEHIPHQEQFIKHLYTLLKKNGVVFFGFPPWQMPFGGHQQICHSKILSKTPYMHLLPSRLYQWILRLFGESQPTVNELLEIKQTGISTRRFEQIIATQPFVYLEKTLYLINPNYETKFGLHPRVQYKWISSIPVLRDFVSTCYYCLIKKV